MTTPIAGIFNSEKDAIAVIEELKAAGCSKEDISVLRRGSEEYEGVSGTNGTEGLAAGAAAGIVLGGAAGILATAGLLFMNEVLSDYVGDYVIFSKNADEDNSFQTTETYKNIPAVQNQHVFEADAKAFYFK
ncbi:hypothetical protein BN871_KE_00050, partial [Paenibacillus sp. P22]